MLHVTCIFQWEYKKLKQRVVECLGHLYRTRSQAFACAKIAYAPKILRKRTVVINIEYGSYSLNFDCS